METNPDVAMKASMYYWEMKNINYYSDSDNIAEVTIRVKGSKDPNEIKRRGGIKNNALDILKN